MLLLYFVYFVLLESEILQFEIHSPFKNFKNRKGYTVKRFPGLLPPTYHSSSQATAASSFLYIFSRIFHVYEIYKQMQIYVFPPSINPSANVLYMLLSAFCFHYFTVYLGDLSISVYKRLYLFFLNNCLLFHCPKVPSFFNQSSDEGLFGCFQFLAIQTMMQFVILQSCKYIYRINTLAVDL